MAITPQDVRDFLSDSVESNLLMDNREEFTDERINLAMRLALSTYNAMPPRTSVLLTNFRDDSVLLYGTLQKLYEGQAALAARNNMSYSDGGVTLPIEERYQMYMQIANTYGQLFSSEAARIKVQDNMEAGWGEVSSDYGFFPNW